MRHGFADSRGFRRTEIGRLGPLTLAGRFRATFQTANFGPAVAARIARRFGGTRRLRRRTGFRTGFGLVSFLRPGFVRGKIGRRFRVRFAKIAGGIGFQFRVLGGFAGRGNGFKRGRRGRNFFGPGYSGLSGYGMRSAAAATPTTAATSAAGTERSGRF